jgi:two-component sensor histidine kinase
MIESMAFIAGRQNKSLLHVGELIHRVVNEYARAISLASLIAAKATNDETRDALREIINHLLATAEIHRVLRPPVADGPMDLTSMATRLCQAMTVSSEFRRRGVSLELQIGSPILIESERCWLACLVLAELVNNSCRHAVSSSGRIIVAIRASHEQVFCKVSDTGSKTGAAAPGLGTRISDALAEELEGAIDRQFGQLGSTVTFSFPRDLSEFQGPVSMHLQA